MVEVIQDKEVCGYARARFSEASRFVSRAVQTFNMTAFSPVKAGIVSAVGRFWDGEGEMTDRDCYRRLGEYGRLVVSACRGESVDQQKIDELMHIVAEVSLKWPKITSDKASDLATLPK